MVVRLFSFMAGVVVSWAFVISEWGVVVIRGGPSLSLGVVVCGHGRCSQGWALSSVGVVVVRGAGRCCLWVRSLFVGLGCRLGVLCRRWWVLGVVEGRPAILWGW